MSKWLPLFPLRMVVFPRTQLPLHIFEDRYKEMVGEAIAAKSEFGVVLAKDEGIVSSGCTVLVDNVLTQYPDGRMDIVTRGCRRFEIALINQDKAYLRAEVEFFDDDEPGPASLELQREVLRQYKKLVETGASEGYSDPNLSDPQLSFQLAQAVRDTDFQAVLLRSRSEADRLKQLISFLNPYVLRVKQTTRMKHLAPLNGYGAKPAGL